MYLTSNVAEYDIISGEGTRQEDASSNVENAEFWDREEDKWNCKLWKRERYHSLQWWEVIVRCNFVVIVRLSWLHITVVMLTYYGCHGNILRLSW